MSNQSLVQMISIFRDLEFKFDHFQNLVVQQMFDAGRALIGVGMSRIMAGGAHFLTALKF